MSNAMFAGAVSLPFQYDGFVHKANSDNYLSCRGLIPMISVLSSQPCSRLQHHWILKEWPQLLVLNLLISALPFDFL